MFTSKRPPKSPVPNSEWATMPNASAKGDEKTDVENNRQTVSALGQKGIIKTNVTGNVKTTTVQRSVQNTTRIVDRHTKSAVQTVTRNTKQTLVGKTADNGEKTTTRTVAKRIAPGTTNVVVVTDHKPLVVKGAITTSSKVMSSTESSSTVKTMTSTSKVVNTTTSSSSSKANTSTMSSSKSNNSTTNSSNSSSKSNSSTSTTSSSKVKSSTTNSSTTSSSNETNAILSSSKDKSLTKSTSKEKNAILSSSKEKTLTKSTSKEKNAILSAPKDKHLVKSLSLSNMLSKSSPRVKSSTTTSSKVEKHVTSSTKVEKSDGNGVVVEETNRALDTVKEKTKNNSTDEKGATVETTTQNVNRRDRLRKMMERRPKGNLKDSKKGIGKSFDAESRSEEKHSVVSKSLDGGATAPEVSFTSTFKGERGFREQETRQKKPALQAGANDDRCLVPTGRNDGETETITTGGSLFGLTSMLSGFVSGATTKAWCVVQNAYGMAYDYYSGSGQWFDWDISSDDEGSDEENEGHAIESGEKAQAKKLRLYNICNELMTTERDYVRKLEILVAAKNKTGHILQPDVAKAMFKDVEVIYEFHHDTLLPELTKRLNTWEKDDRIGDIMKKLAPFLKLSTEYVKQFEAALTLVETWQKKSTPFAALLREIAENPEYGRLQLNAHMMEPVQRIPRYGLLLRDYVKHLPKDSRDKPDAEKALELVENAALHFENMMKRDSVIGQLLKVQRQLECRFGIVSPSRELIKEGKIMKVSIKNGKPTERYAFLFNDILLLCSEHVLHVGKRYKVRDVVGVAEIQMSESENKDLPHAFYIMTTEKVFELCSSSSKEKTKWQNAIWKQVGECTKNKLRTLRTVEADVNRKCVGKRAPVLVRYGDVSMCMVCAGEYNTIKRKHHCRGCGIVVCAKCSAHTARLAYDKAKPLRICDGCFIVLFDEGNSKYSKGGAMAVGRQQSEAHGNVAHKGYLEFSGDGGRNFKKRWLVLNDNNSLYLFKAPQDLKPALTIRMDGASTEKVEVGPRKKRVVKLETERKVYLLHDQDEQVLEKWVEMFGTIAPSEPTTPMSP